MARGKDSRRIALWKQRCRSWRGVGGAPYSSRDTRELRLKRALDALIAGDVSAAKAAISIIYQRDGQSNFSGPNNC